MNTTPCPACENQVSRRALSCPHCAHPLRMSLANKVRWTFGSILVAIILFFAYAIVKTNEINEELGITWEDRIESAQ